MSDVKRYWVPDKFSLNKGPSFANIANPDEAVEVVLAADYERLERGIEQAKRVDQLARELADYKEAHEDKQRLCREIDEIISGKDGMAKQASLCDLVEPIRELKLEVEAQRHLRDEAHEFHDAAMRDAYSLLEIDGSDGEFRYKWVSLEIANLKREHAALKATLAKLPAGLKSAHYINLVVRRNGKDAHYEADYLKEAQRLLARREESCDK